MIFHIPKVFFWMIEYCTQIFNLKYALCMTQCCVMIPCVTVVTAISEIPIFFRWVIFFLKNFEWEKFCRFFSMGASLTGFNVGLYAQEICFGAYSGLLLALIISKKYIVWVVCLSGAIIFSWLQTIVELVAPDFLLA